MQRTIYFIITFSLIFLAACGSGENSISTTNFKTVPVTATPVNLLPLSATQRYSGNVEALEAVQLSTRISGWVEKIYVSEGQQVQQGQTLVKLGSADLEAKRAQTEAQIAEANVHFENAATNLKRIQALYQKGAATQKELDDMNAAYASARARQRTAREAKNEVEAILRYSELKAPFNGVVTVRLLEEGDLANPGQPVLIVENQQQLLVSAQVGETDFASLSVDMLVRAEITVAGSTAPLLVNGRIDRIIPSADPLSRQFEIKVLLTTADTRIKPGMFARVAIAGENDNALLIPQTAVFQRGQLEGVYVVDEKSIARLRWIRSGLRQGEFIVALSGLNPGETIVTSGMAQLLDGQPVEVRK